MSVVEFDLVREIELLLNGLLQLGRDHPELLIYLAGVVRPHLDQNQCLALCSNMMAELPSLFSKLNPAQLPSLLSAPPADAAALCLFVELRALRKLLCSISAVQLLHLTNNVIPSGPQDYKLRYLTGLQRTVALWVSGHRLSELQLTLKQTPLLLERTRLAELDSSIPGELLYVCSDLLKLPTEDLADFAAWFGQLDSAALAMLVHLLQLEPSVLFHIRAVFMYQSLPEESADNMEHQMQVVRAAEEASMAENFSEQDRQRERQLIEEQQRKQSGHDNKNAAAGVPGSGAKKRVGGSSDELGDAFVSSVKRRRGGGVAKSDENTGPASNTAKSRATSATGSGGSVAAAAAAAASAGVGADNSGGAPVPPCDQTASSAFPGIRLKVCTQPPRETVYQRILKPPPAVQLEHSGTDEGRASLAQLLGESRRTGLFVEAAVCTEKSTRLQPAVLQGTKMVKLQNATVAQFRKLKITVTSQRQGSNFRVAFYLKRPVGAQGWQIIDGATCYSHPIEVFSHTGYLSDRIAAKQNNSEPGVAAAAAAASSSSSTAPNDTLLYTVFSMKELIPASAKPGSKMVILGTGFLKSPKLTVRFGSSRTVQPQFHETGTLVVSIPSDLPVGSIAVAVSNNGTTFCPPKQLLVDRK